MDKTLVVRQPNDVAMEDNNNNNNEQLYGVKRSRDEFLDDEPNTPASPSVSRPHKKLRKVNYNNQWAYLPREALFIVLKYFSKPELIHLGRVCQHWYATSRLNVLWSSLHNFNGFKVCSLDEVCSMFDDVFRGRAPITELTLPKNCATLSAAEFRRLRVTCLQLKELNLPVANSETVQSIDDACLREISNMKTLCKINLSTHKQITDEGLYELMCGLSQSLTYINVDHCRGITAQTVITALRTCTRLESFSALFCANATLSSSHLKELTFAGESVGRRLESFSIELADNACEQRDIIHDFLKQFGNTLKSLHLRGWRHINPIMSDELTQICKSLFRLEKLTVACNATMVATENHSANRSALLIESDTIKEILLSRFENLNRPIFKCSLLETLHLESIMSLQDVSLVTPHLTEFKIRSCRLELNEQNTPFDKILESVPSLRKLDVFDCTGISRLNVSQRKNGGLESLDLFMCSDLEEVTLKCEGLKNLNIDACQELKRARIECPNLCTATLFALPQPMQFPIMDYLYLSSQQLTNLSLPRCVNLQFVQLDCPNLISINMNECKVLQELELACPNLEKLALSGPRMTFNSQFAQDLGARCPKIHMLSLSNVPMDDEALRHISGWSTLRALVISNCERLVNPWIQNYGELKGLQLLDCPNLESPVVQCDKLIKLFYRNCPKLDNTALSLAGCNDLKFIEVLNCAALEHVKFESNQCHTVHFGSCHKLTSLELDTPNIGKLSVSDCTSFKDWRFTQVANRLAEVVLDKVAISDSAIATAAQMSPNVQTCHIKLCPALREPIIPWANLKLIDFLECGGLMRPSLSPTIARATVSFKVCPRLCFQDFSEISSSVDFVEIVNCEGLVGKVRFPLHGMNRLNIALCHRLGSIELYTNHMTSSRLEKLLITHCRELRTMHVEANQRPIIAQFKDCPHLNPPNLDPPARVIARMMGCFSLGCQGTNVMIERNFGAFPSQPQLQPPHPFVQQMGPSMPMQFPHPQMVQRGFPFPVLPQQIPGAVGGFPFPGAPSRRFQ